MPIFSFEQGTAPLLLSIPHSGVELPADLSSRLTDTARALPDTDWFVDRLYAFAAAMGCSVIKANYSRYVVDLNRPPDGAPLYPGRSETGLCPTTDFSNAPLYRDASSLAEAEIGTRVDRYWRPYHEAIEAEIERMLDVYGIACLWDAHSIPSFVPRFFEGELPELNLGTAGGRSCASWMREAVWPIIQNSDYSSVLDGRFKGGYITRRYGDPKRNVHAAQLEIAQRAYMHEGDTPEFDDRKAAALQALLKAVLRSVLDGASVECRTTKSPARQAPS